MNNGRLTVSLAAIIKLISWSRMTPTSAQLDQLREPLPCRSTNALTVVPPRKVFQESAFIDFDLLTLLYHLPLVFQRTLNDRIHKLLDDIRKRHRQITRQLGQRPKGPKRVPLEHNILNLGKCLEKRTESAFRFVEGQRIQTLTEEELGRGVGGEPVREICYVHGLSGFQVR